MICSIIFWNRSTNALGNIWCRILDAQPHGNRKFNGCKSSDNFWLKCVRTRKLNSNYADSYICPYSILHEDFHSNWGGRKDPVSLPEMFEQCSMDIWWEREFHKLVNNFWNYLADDVSMRSDSTDKSRNSARQNDGDVPEQMQRWQLSHWNLKYPRLNSPIQISVILNSTIQSLAFMRQTIIENRYELQKPVVTTSNHQDI